MNKYIAFISYSRKDKETADWLHSKLEKFVLPDLEKARQIFPFKDKYFRPVFMDTQDLHVEERPFTDRLKEALRDSRFLIVLCSRNSAKSKFVDMEIKYFLETHNNNLSLIIPLFIDEVNDCIPEAFEGTTIMTRHFPIYNTKLSKSSEANNYCFYQIVSYILGIRFSTLYNRYEIETARNNKKKNMLLLYVITALAVIIGIMGIEFYMYHSESQKALDRKQKLIEFEKKVFPQAVVHGYEGNFLTPVIKYLKKEPKEFSIYILLPTNERDLTHQNRVEDFEYQAKMQLGIDSLTVVKLPTEAKRGSSIMQVVKDGRPLDGVYLDFATTTTSFLDIAKFKRKNREYRNTPLDSIIGTYAEEFKTQTNEHLKSDSTFVKFYFDKNDLINDLQNKIK